MNAECGFTIRKEMASLIDSVKELHKRVVALEYSICRFEEVFVVDPIIQEKTVDEDGNQIPI
jgi:hypothetical protein